MSGHYVLDGHTPVLEPSLERWAGWWARTDNSLARVVKQEHVGPYWISTVFLGLDHQFFNGPPILFETMAFLGEDLTEANCERCSTWDEAEAQHAAMVAKYRAVESNGERA